MGLTRVAGALLVFSSALAGTALAGPPATPRFHFEPAEMTLPFSSKDAGDKLSAEIDGASCDDARVRFKVRGEKGAELYAFEAPYYQFVGTDCSPATADHLVALNDLRREVAEGLPHLPSEESVTISGFEILVPRETYERLVLAGATILELPSGPGETLWVAYDVDAGKGIAVLRKSWNNREVAGLKRFNFESKLNDRYWGFSSAESLDELSLEIHGDACADAVFRVRVESAAGAELYRFEAPYSRFSAGDCSPEKATAFLDGEPMKFAAEFLPRPPAPGESGRGFKILVPRETYDRLRTGPTVPMVLKHPVGGGEVRWVVFDRQESKAVAVLRTTDELARRDAQRKAARRSPGFGYRDSAHIAFSSKDETDLLEISVLGDSCETATYRVRVTDPRGRELYSYEEPYPGGDACAQESVEGIVEWGVDSAGNQRSGNLAPYPSSPDDAVTTDEIPVPKETYERLRAANLPVLTISIGEESFGYVVYDPESGKGVIIEEPNGG